MSKKLVMLCIMDGFGWTPDETYGNAVAAANKPNLDKIFANYPMTTIQASGMAVGLPDGQMGNSEVGHTNMGAGRIVYQQLTLITKSIKDGEMFKNPVLVKNMKAAIDAGKAIHLMGLVGTGGVHSHADHWFGVLEMAKHMGAKDVYLHCIMDGRDTDPHSGKGFLADLQAKLDELGIGKIASVSGRYYAMDRDNNWDREEKAYAAFVYGEGNHAANAAEAIEASYAADKTDEFVLPCVTCEGGRVQDGDTVIFMNFRPDRARQMTRIFCDDDFKGFERRGGRKQVHYVCMAEYDATMPNCEVAYPPVELKNVLGQYLSENGKTQLRIAETEKYAHVTFFFNGGVEAPYEGEDRCVIPSPKVATYDLKPEMSAPEVAAECVKRIESGKYDVVILNFANCDMVGHTGVFDAAVKAVEAVDTAVDQVVSAVLNAGGCAFITADHGNIEKLYTVAGKPDGSHTTNLVPFILIDSRQEDPISLRDGALCDVAPTILDVMGLPQPLEMTGRSLAEGHAWSRGRRMLLIICDGWGLGAGDEGDAIHLAHTPYWDALLENRSWCRLQASREFVGLGAGKAGNSEAGHSNLGAGRCVMQDDVRLDAAVQDGSFARNPVFLEAIEHARRNHASLHLLAYLTHKSSHGCIDYPLAICEMAKKQGLEEVYFHIIFDGRSTEPGSAPALLAELDSRLDQVGLGRSVDGVGRGVVLDRDKNYDKGKRAYDALTDGLGAWYS